MNRLLKCDSLYDKRGYCVGIVKAVLSSVSTGMGDCLRAGKLSHYVTSHPTQANSAWPSFRG